jgi:hypothetical protein
MYYAPNGELSRNVVVFQLRIYVDIIIEEKRDTARTGEPDATPTRSGVLELLSDHSGKRRTRRTNNLLVKRLFPRWCTIWLEPRQAASQLNNLAFRNSCHLVLQMS